jgi:hypothetical protein
MVACQLTVAQSWRRVKPRDLSTARSRRRRRTPAASANPSETSTARISPAARKREYDDAVRRAPASAAIDTPPRRPRRTTTPR